MKILPTLIKGSIALFSILNCTAQEIWDGPTILFSKAAFANWTEPENQDRITENVWITRADSRGIFNFFLEESYINDLSPQDTEWAFGTTQEIEKLSFTDWETAVNENPPGSIDQPMVVHLISEDIYIDLVFRSWGQGGEVAVLFRTSAVAIPAWDLKVLPRSDLFSTLTPPMTM